MAVDMKSAASVVPKLITGSLAASDTVIYTCPVGVTATIRKTRLTNVDGSSRNVTLSLVRAADASGVTNRLMNGEPVASNARVDLGGGDVLNEGDAIWGFAPSSTNVDVLISLIEFGGAAGGALSGIQDDAFGIGGRTSATGTVTGSVPVLTTSNRCVVAALTCTMTTTGPSYASYDTLTMLCGALPMTRLISVDFNDSGALGGSVHWFGILNPPSGTTPTLTANVAESGKSFNLTLLPPMSKSGVASFGATASTGPSSAAAMSLALASAVGRRVLFAGGFDVAPMDFNQPVRGFNGNPAVGFTRPHFSIQADAPGAALVTATTGVSQSHCGAAVELIAA